MNCKFCGATEEQNQEFGMIDIYDYDLEADEDGPSSIRDIVARRCAHVTACARRVLEQGNNVEGLRMVISERANLGDEMANEARQILHQMSEIVQMQARQDDDVAREMGRL